MPSVDVIIPTYNNAAELIQCLDGFGKQSFKKFQCFVCIDGSEDDTETRLAESVFPFKIHILKHHGNVRRGRNASRNLAIPYLESNYLITVDSDMVPADNFLEKHVEFLSVNTGIAQGRVIYLNRRTNPWADYIQSRGKNKYSHHSELPPYYLTTGNAAMPTEYFIAVGGQDPEMTTYGGGDTEFAYRLHQKYKLPVFYNAEAIAYSEMNKDLKEAVRQMKEFGAVNLPYIRKKHPEFNTLFHVHKFESKTLHHRLFKRLLGHHVTNLCFFFAQLTRGGLRRKIIHLMVFSAIYQGYKSYQNKKTETV